MNIVLFINFYREVENVLKWYVVMKKININFMIEVIKFKVYVIV